MIKLIFHSRVLRLSALLLLVLIAISRTVNADLTDPENQTRFGINQLGSSFLKNQFQSILIPESISPISSVYLRNQKLTVSDGENLDQMGNSVAISGDTVVIGINADKVGNNPTQGSAVVFVRVGDSWVKQGEKLVAIDGGVDDQFGSSVVILGDTIVVGAPLHDHNGFGSSGAAYVFTRSNGVWTQTAKIVNSTDFSGDSIGGDFFGEKLGTDGSGLVISSRFDITTVGQGSVAFFSSVPTAGTVTVPLTSKIKRAGSIPNVVFGRSVDVLGSTVFVGSANETTGEVLICTTGTCAPGYPDSSFVKRLIGPSVDRTFGISVAVDENTLVIGESGSSTSKAYVSNGPLWTTPVQLGSTNGYIVAVDEDLIAVGRPSGGRVFLFRKTNQAWTEKATLLQKENATFGDNFGVSVAVEGNKIIGGSTSGTTNPSGAASIFINAPSRQFDFENDELANISVFRTSNNTWYVRQPSAPGGYTDKQFGESGDIRTPADFDGDGKTDVAVFRPSTGTWHVQGSTQGYQTFQWGLANDIPVPNDFDGDGKADIAVYRPSNFTWYWISSSNQVINIVPFGETGVIPVIADFDGDQYGELATFKASTGVWNWKNLQNSAIGTRTWGTTGDILVPADYDGDLKTDTVVFRPSNSTWYRWYSSNNAISSVTWGATGDKPVPADYDGDGETDIAVFRPGNNTWYILNSSYPSLVAAPWSEITFGITGDIAIPTAFQ